MSDSDRDHDEEEKEEQLSEQDTLKRTKRDDDEPRPKRKKKKKRRKKKKPRFNKKGENPNPMWQKKFGRTSPNSNVYEIPDVNEKECGSSNEWCTPQASAHCGACVFCISIIGLILMITVFAINMSAWSSEWGAADCSGTKVYDKISAFRGWEYLSGAIIITSIVGTCCSCYVFWRDRPYTIDKDRRPKKDIEDWDLGWTRIFCRMQIFLWIFLFLLLFIWFWIMIGIMSGLDDVASTVNCTPDSVQDAARKKGVAFGMLVAFSLIGAVCCGLPLALALVNGRADDDQSGI